MTEQGNSNAAVYAPSLKVDWADSSTNVWKRPADRKRVAHILWGHRAKIGRARTQKIRNIVLYQCVMVKCLDFSSRGHINIL